MQDVHVSLPSQKAKVSSRLESGLLGLNEIHSNCKRALNRTDK